MSQYQTEVSEIINAAPERVYAVLSDYRVGHPAILPQPYFTGLAVEQGGNGAGTIVRVSMKVFGRIFNYRLVVTEPQPGRVLAEEDSDAGIATTFTVEPLNGGKQSRVTIATTAQASPGLTGLMERLLNPLVTRRIYQQELHQLDQYLRQPA